MSCDETEMHFDGRTGGARAPLSRFVSGFSETSNERQNTRHEPRQQGTSLRELSLHLLALDHFCWAAKAQRARTDPLAYSAATVANRQRTHLTAGHLHRELHTGSRRRATWLKS